MPEAKREKGTGLRHRQMLQDQNHSFQHLPSERPPPQVPNNAHLFTMGDCGWHDGLHTLSAHMASALRTEPGEGPCVHQI